MQYEDIHCRVSKFEIKDKTEENSGSNECKLFTSVALPSADKVVLLCTIKCNIEIMHLSSVTYQSVINNM